MAERAALRPGIADHGLIGDRRTAALVAFDGTLDWCCLPDFDSSVFFGSLLDAHSGGFWRLGPASGAAGRQDYVDHSAVLRTRWQSETGAELELTDAMLWPDRHEDSPDRDRRLVLRRLHCRGAPVRCVHQFVPRLDFGPAVATVLAQTYAAALPPQWLGLWCSDPRIDPRSMDAAPFELAPGETVWFVLGLCEQPDLWTETAADEALSQTLASWERWAGRHPYFGPLRQEVLASLRTIRLLSYEPRGSQVAAPTTSLPERIGGDRNYDYRFAWVRDASLALAILAVFGDLDAAERYMDWLCERDSRTDMPLQVLYGIDGRCETQPRTLDKVAGYADSRPVRLGNHAAEQFQLDSLGYFGDCAKIYLEQGGRWRQAYTGLVARNADFTAAHWQREDNGIWELDQRRHYVSSKLMGWVVLDRAQRIFARLRLQAPPRWGEAAAALREDIMSRGWCEARQAFRQHDDTDEPDASTLLMFGMEFLPPDHPRMVANVATIQRELARGPFVWRFHPRALGHEGMPLDGLEGAFIPCSFWLASALARMKRSDEARKMLEDIDAAYGQRGLYSEEFDPASGQALGNFPMVFCHAEHLKAVMDLAKSQPLQMAGLMAGKLAGKLARALTPG